MASLLDALEVKAFSLTLEYRDVELDVSGEWLPSVPTAIDNGGNWLPSEAAIVEITGISHKGETILSLFDEKGLEELEKAVAALLES